jgi:ribosome-associated translation inhibitor RaiA
MPIQIDLVTKDIALTGAAKDEIKARGEHLQHFDEKLSRVRITLEGPSRHHKQGLFKVKIDVHVPGAELVVEKEHTKDLQIALREAFDAATRRIEDHVRRRRGFVKKHEEKG